MQIDGYLKILLVILGRRGRHPKLSQSKLQQGWFFSISFLFGLTCVVWIPIHNTDIYHTLFIILILCFCGNIMRMSLIYWIYFCKFSATGDIFRVYTDFFSFFAIFDVTFLLPSKITKEISTAGIFGNYCSWGELG